jgi:FtsZ-binding cell division protein ZapB
MIMPSEQIEETVIEEPNTPPEMPDNADPKDDNLDKGIRKRLAKQAENFQAQIDAERRKSQEAQARLDEAQSKLSQYEGEGSPQTIPIDAIPYLQQHFEEQTTKKQNMTKAISKIQEAAEQDKELSELAQEKGGMFNEDDFSLMGKLSDGIPNLAGVAKELMKNGTDFEIYKSAPNEYEKAKFLRELSEKLDNRNTGSGNKKYEPAEPLSGSSVPSDDLSKYVNKYRGRRR